MHDGGPGGRAPPKNRCLRGVWSYGVWRATGAPWASVKSRIISDPRLPGSHARTRAQRHPATDRLAFSVLGSTSSRYILRGWIDRIFANIQIAGPLAGARRAGLRRRRTLALESYSFPTELLVSPQSLHAPPCAHSRSSRFPTEPSRFPTEPSCSPAPLRTLSLFSFLVSPQNLLVSRLPVCVLASCGRRRSSDKREW